MSKEFVRHDKCEKCGSDDNLSVYYNDELGGETWYCQTPGCDNVKTDNDLALEKGVKFASHLTLPPYKKMREVRGLNVDTLMLYSVGVSNENNLTFPYYRDGKLVAYKSLSPKLDDKGKKIMWLTGNTKKLPMFGQQTTNEKRKSLILTEGEIDAMSAYQMKKLCACSIPTGADSALKSVKENIVFLEQFDRVYVCFDSDDAGQIAATEVMDFLRPGHGYRVNLRLKDANEYLKLGTPSIIKEFNTAIDNAQPRKTDVVYSRDELEVLFDEIINGYTSSDEGIKTGIDGLDNVGFRLLPEDVTTIFSDPAVGKSSLCRQICANLLHQHIPILLFCYEESERVYLEKILNMYYRMNLTPNNKKDLEKDIKDNIMPLITVSKVYDDNIDRISEAIEIGVRVSEAKVIFFDNITACTAGSGDMVNKIGEVYVKLASLGKQYKHHTVVVSHTRRDNNLKSEQGEIPSMRHGFGSGGIERYSYNVLALGRAEGSDILGVAIRKNRTTGELCEFKMTWNHNTKSFDEVNTYGITTVKQRGTEESGLRLPTRVGLPQDDAPFVYEDYIEATTRDVPSDDSVQLQPRLCDTMCEGEHLSGGEGQVNCKLSLGYQ